MAVRRMFSQSITESDAFLDMPSSAQNLYFHLGMVADDDGFVNAPKRVMRIATATEDDLKLLIAKKFIIPFEQSGIVVIKHWKVNNYIQKDRYNPTKYNEEFELLIVDKRGVYHEIDKTSDQTLALIEAENGPHQYSEYEKRRIDAIKNGDLPPFFNSKIRKAFHGKECPVCGCKMDLLETYTKPTIQHNKPISKGGTNTLDNISVICASCNNTIRDRETGPLNNEEVKKEWAKICGVSDVYRDSVSIDKNRLEENRLDKSSIDENRKSEGKGKTSAEVMEEIKRKRKEQSELF